MGARSRDPAEGRASGTTLSAQQPKRATTLADRVTGSVKRPSTPVEDFDELQVHFERALRGRPVSADTLDLYRRVLTDFKTYLQRERIRLVVANLAQAVVQSYLIDLLERRTMARSTVQKHFRYLHAFFAWLETDGWLDRSPMLRMKLPRADSPPPDAISSEDHQAMLKWCRGRDFFARRDKAMLMVLYDTGMRRGELISMTLDHLKLGQGLALVKGKRGFKEVQLKEQAVEAMSAYLLVRKQTFPDYADHPALWLGRQGVLKVRSVNWMIDKRAGQAGLVGIHPHMYRHALAGDWLRDGGNIDELMEIGGWETLPSVRKYTRKNRHARALERHKSWKRGDHV